MSSNHLTVPQTPKVISGHSAKSSISFGLGFSPSFPFSSPNNINLFASFSPQRFLLNHENHHNLTSKPNLIDFQTFTPPDSQIRRKIFQVPNDKDRPINDEDIFEIFPDLNNRKDESLSAIDEEKENDLPQVVDSSFDNTIISPNMIHKQPFNAHDTPSITKTRPEIRVVLSDKTNHIDNNEENIEAKASDAEDRHNDDKYETHTEYDEVQKLDHIADQSAHHSQAQSQNAENSPNDYDDKILKKRKLSTATINSAKSYSINSITPTNEKVWTDDLDILLIESLKQVRYLKIRRPKEKFAQNKIISQLIFEKTGIIRTSKQIASRINYLNKRKINPKHIARPNEASVTTPSLYNINKYSPIDDNLENLINTPIGFANPDFGRNLSTASSKDDEALEKTVQSLLSSSPIMEFKSPAVRKNQSVPIFTRKSTLFQAEYDLEPEDFKIQFNYTNGENFVFTKLSSKAVERHDIGNGGKNLKSLNEQLDLSANQCLVNDLSESDSLNLNKISNIFTINSDISLLNESINLMNGKIESFLKLNVKTFDKSSNRSLLNWKCATRVYDDNKLLVKLNESINGFQNYERNLSSNDSTNFTLQIPFLSSFWSGYLSFVSNGGTSSLKNLSIVQFLYEGEEKDCSEPGLGGIVETKGKIHACLIYNFKTVSENESENSSRFTKINLNYGNYSTVSKSNIEDSPCDKDIVLKSDDNTVDIDDDETVAASPRNNHLNSSPIVERTSNSKHRRTTSNTQNLSIEIPDSNKNHYFLNNQLVDIQRQNQQQPPYMNNTSTYQPSLQPPFPQSLQRQVLINSLNPQQQQVLNNSYLLQQQLLQSGPPSAPIPLQSPPVNNAFDMNYVNHQQKLFGVNPEYQNFVQRQFHRQHQQFQLQQQQNRHFGSLNNGLRSAPITQLKFFEDANNNYKASSISNPANGNNFKSIIEYKPSENLKHIDAGDIRRSMSQGNIQFQFYKPS